MQNGLSGLEMRMDSLEIDIARQQGSREDDARRVAGEMAVMKARVEDALVAFAGTAEDLREMMRAAEKRFTTDVVAGVPEAYKAQLAAAMDGVMAGMGDALETFSTEVRGRVEVLSAHLVALQQTMGSIADTMVSLAPLPGRLAKLEETVARLSTEV